MEIEKESEKVNRLSLETLELSSRTFHALRRVSIFTVGDALKMIELDKRSPRLHIPNFGKKGYEELITKMRKNGYLEQVK